MAELGDDEFVGYHFAGAPEIRHRLWFLERELHLLGLWGTYSIPVPGMPDTIAGHHIVAGLWTVDMRKHLQDGRRASRPMRGGRIAEALSETMPGLHVRWESVAGTAAVWRLTDLTIPHVHTFGRDDDVWRLGVWPD